MTRSPYWLTLRIQSDFTVYLAFIICYVIFLAFFLGVTDFQERDRAVIRFNYSYFQLRVMRIKGLLPPLLVNSHMNPAFARDKLQRTSL